MARIIDINTKKPIFNSEIKIIGVDYSQINLKTDSLGFVKTQIKFGVQYLITASAPEYLIDKSSKLFEKDKYEAKQEFTVSQIFELRKLEECTGMLPLVVYEFNKFKKPVFTSQKSQSALESFVGLLKINPNLRVEFTAYRDSLEKAEISEKRLDFLIKRLIKNGIDTSRVYIVDGSYQTNFTDNLRNSKLNIDNLKHNRFLVFKIIGLISDNEN